MSNPVRHRLVAVSAAVCAVLLAFTVASCGSQPASPTAPAVNTGDTDAKGGSTQQCGPGGIKDEKAPFAAMAPEGEIVTGVCVKAGMNPSVASRWRAKDIEPRLSTIERLQEAHSQLKAEHPELVKQHERELAQL